MALLLYRIGRSCARHRGLVLALWILAIAGIIALSALAGGALRDNLSIPGSETDEATALLEDRFPAFAGGSATVVFRGDPGFLKDPRAAGGVTATLDRIRALPHVVAVTNPTTPDGRAQVSADGRTAYADVRYDVPALEVGNDGAKALIAALALARDAGLQAEAGGELIYMAQVPQTSGAELAGLAFAVVILLVAFGSLIAMGLPIVITLAAAAVGLSLITLVAAVVDIPADAPTVALMIGIGVGIDYALFVVTRHREYLAQGLTVQDAAGRATATAGQAVLFAGGTVVIAILGLWFTGISFVGSIGLGAAIVVAVAVTAALTLLPALLGLVGRWIDRLRVPGFRPRTEAAVAADGRHHGWSRWAHHVAGHPWPYWIGGAALLLLLAAPVLRLELGQPDAGNDDGSTTQRRAYDLLAQGFGPGFNGPLTVVATLPAEGGLESPANAAFLDAVTRTLEADPDIASIGPVIPSPAGDTAILIAIPRSAPQDAATKRLVDRLRSGPLEATAGDAGPGARVLVTGPTAAFIDISDALQRSLPVFIGAVVLLSCLLLLMVFRSVLVPLKAAVLNLLSIGAAYGIVVAVFQWGWGLRLLGIEEPVPIISVVPMFMFAILFGLSMDYEVFLLSRVREEYLRTGDSNESVATGLARTARVITSAALIMIGVFLAFAANPSPLVKMFGVGLATAVFVDATVVRLVLVPATMALLGRANWWLPAWLNRLLPKLDIEGDRGLPEPEYDIHAGAEAIPSARVGAG